MEDIESLVAEFLGPRFSGRRFLRYAELESLGVIDNRATLALWVSRGAFPAPLRIPGRFGKTLVWLVPEVVRHLAAARLQIPATTSDSARGRGPGPIIAM
jgi:hypothetical protein